MRVLFFAPRFHTNQIPIIKALLNAGYDIRFLVHYKGAIEDYSILEPEILRNSMLSKYIIQYIEKRKIGDTKKIHLKMKYYIPKKRIVKQILKEFNPDLVIVRDRMLSSAIFTYICKKLKFKIILYNQLPLEYIDNNKIKRILDKIFFPKYRITPIKNRESEDRYGNSFYLPFVAPTVTEIYPIELKDREAIKICTVGKFYKRKNFLLLLDAFFKLALVFNVKLTIIGEVSDDRQESYYKEVCNKVKEYNLEDKVRIKRNVPYNKMGEEYNKNDIFVLASTQEPAAISHLEAMSYGLFAICSSNNGTAGYIEPGITGDVFQDNNVKDLYMKLYSVCKKIEVGEIDKNRICKYVQENYSADIYIKKFLSIYSTVNN